MAAKKHTHRYHKLDGMWHCSLSDCTHFMPKNVAMNILGKLSVCWACGEEFRLYPNALRMDKPQCINCEQPELTETVEELVDSKTPHTQKMLDTFIKQKMG